MVLYKPYDYQFNGIHFLYKNRQSALFADMGTGKTVMVLTYLNLLKRENKNNTTLIIAPKRVCNLVWPKEIIKWDHTKHLKYLKLETEDELQYNLKAFDILIINSENIFPYIEYLSKICDTLVVDESTDFKSTKSKRFRTIKPLIKKFRNRTILSGTPIPDSYQDLFTQYYIVDNGRILTNSITSYRKTFFDLEIKGYHTKYPIYTLKSGAEDIINELVAPVTMRIDKSNNLNMPDVIYDDIYTELNTKGQKTYNILEKELIMDLDDQTLIVDNASVKFIRCHQFSNGIIYTDKNKNTKEIHREKITALKELIDSLQGKPLLIAYHFKSDLAFLNKYFKKYKIKNFGINDQKDVELEESWNKGKIRLLTGHYDSIGHGLNLQFGSNHICCFSLYAKYGSFVQFIARLARDGQKDQNVFVHRLIVKNTLDEYLLEILNGKEATQKLFFEYLERKQKDAFTDTKSFSRI